MKQTLLLALLSLSVINFSGCAGLFCDAKTIEKTVYLKQKIPALSNKPKAENIQVQYVEFKGETYVFMSKEDAALLASNWESFKSWADENYKILLELKKD